MASVRIALLVVVALVRSIVTPAALIDSKATPMLRNLLRRYRVPGASVTFIERGHVMPTVAVGAADAAGNPVTPDTRFEVGSLSKTPAAIALLSLVDRRVLGLDQPVSGPAWPSELEGRQPAVTIRRLLDHTAGISVEGYPGDPAPLPMPTLPAALAGRDGAPAVQEAYRPGRFHYSGGGYALAQQAAERLTGRTFRQISDEAVVVPAGLTRTIFDGGLDSARLAQPFARTGKPVTLRRFAEVAPEGVVTTSRDYATFLARVVGAEHSTDPAPLVSPQLAAEVFRAQPGTRGADGMTRQSAYGLGTFIATDRGRRVTAWHPGVNPGWAAMYALDPDKGDGVVVLTNSDTGIHLAADVVCGWARGGDRSRPRICGVMERGGTTILAATAVTSPVLLATSVSTLIGEVRPRRRRSLSARRTSRHRSRLLLLCIPAGIIAFGNTDFVPRHIWGDAVLPVWLLPHALAVAVSATLASCAVWVLVRALHPQAEAHTRRRLTRLALGGAVALGWWTTAVSGGILGMDKVVPARDTPRLLSVLVTAIVVALAASALRLVGEALMPSGDGGWSRWACPNGQAVEGCREAARGSSTSRDE